MAPNINSLNGLNLLPKAVDLIQSLRYIVDGEEEMVNPQLNWPDGYNNEGTIRNACMMLNLVFDNARDLKVCKLLVNLVLNRVNATNFTIEDVRTQQLLVNIPNANVLQGRVEVVQGLVDGINTRLNGFDNQVQDLRGQVQGIDDRLGGLENTQQQILDILRAMNPNLVAGMLN